MGQNRSTQRMGSVGCPTADFLSHLIVFELIRFPTPTGPTTSKIGHLFVREGTFCRRCRWKSRCRLASMMLCSSCRFQGDYVSLSHQADEDCIRVMPVLGKDHVERSQRRRPEANELEQATVERRAHCLDIRNPRTAVMLLLK